MSRVLDFFARGTVALVDAARRLQTLQVRITAGEVKDAVEHLEPYGFTSRPHPGAEAVLGFVGGDRSHCVALVVGDRRYRLVGLETGELALYSDEGDSLVFRRGNRIEVATHVFAVAAEQRIELAAGEAIVLTAPQITGTGAASLEGDVDISGGALRHNGTNVGDDHAHDGVVAGSETSGAPV